MNLNNIKKQAGLTLIEVTLVIAVLLGLISVLFIGVSAYKEGSNRAKCILNITNCQKAVRSYQNMYEKAIGDDLTLETLVGEGKMLETDPECPSGGEYTGAGDIPEIGIAYLTCDYETGTEAAHVPASTSGW
jgi:type II secretory pathway pseudopilin PulG